jgi:hypothetical protein
MMVERLAVCAMTGKEAGDYVFFEEGESFFSSG